MVHRVCGAPLLYSNGAPDMGAPLVAILLMAHLVCGAPPLSFSWAHPLPRLTSGAPWFGAPLLVLTSNGALFPGAPLLTFAHHTSEPYKKFTKCTPPWDRLSSFKKIKENDSNVKKIKENKIPM